MHRPDVVLNHPKRDDNRRPRSKRNERESPKSDTDSEQRQHHRQIPNTLPENGTRRREC